MGYDKRLALLVCIFGSTIVGIDGSVLGVALPAISDDLGGGLAGQQWASNAYLLTLGSLLLLGGALGTPTVSGASSRSGWSASVSPRWCAWPHRRSGS